MSESQAYSLLVALGGFLIIIALIVIALEVVIIVGKWKLFKKAGKNGWEAIIPFYSDWVVVEIAGLDWWWFLLLIAPTIITALSVMVSTLGALSYLGTIAAIFARVSIFMNLSKKLHRDTSFVVLGAIFGDFVLAAAGYSNSYQYDSSVEVSKMGIIDNIAGKNNQQTVNPNNATNANQDVLVDNEQTDINNEQTNDQSSNQ